MPFYEYRCVDEIACDHCREGFTVRQGMRDEPLVICPRCGAAIERAVLPFQVSRKREFSERKAKRAGFKIYRRDEGGYTET